jgi:anthranilate phosphoribosyltransferase
MNNPLQMDFPTLLAPLAEGKDLAPDQAEALMDYLMGGEATAAQIGGALMALRVKGTTTAELAAFARVLRRHAATLRHEYDDLVDTCGTGGGRPSFNISTAAAVAASAAGVRIAKHGNRAVTSRCGSADVLEALGVRLEADPERLLHLLDTVGLVFLFAPHHHPAMRHVGPARRELGVRTVFNQLGPLANPACASRQLIGVYEPGLMRSMGEALRVLGTRRALIVHGRDGLDEISPVADTEYVKVWDGQVTSGRLSVKDFGLDAVPEDALAPGETAEENAAILREALEDPSSPRSRAILPSAAAAIWLGGQAENLPSATERAREAVASGAAARKLGELISMGAAE